MLGLARHVQQNTLYALDAERKGCEKHGELLVRGYVNMDMRDGL